MISEFRIICAVALLPFIYFSCLDNLYHFKSRRVPKLEHLMHFVIGLALFRMLQGFWAGQYALATFGLAGTAFFGALDEFIFHRNIGERETDLHAKAHWSLVIFLATGFYYFRYLKGQ